MSCDKCTASYKRERGCGSTPKAYTIKCILYGDIINTCPLYPMKEDPEFFYAIFESYNWYKKGMLPEQGTWRDQSPRFVHFMLLIDRVFDLIEQKRDEKNKKK